MSRIDEYNELLAELETSPTALDFTFTRAQAKLKGRRRRHRFFTIPAGGLATFLVVFILLVNLSPVFAYSAGQLPILRELAKAVALSPSLRAAVENQYVQPIGTEATQNGITTRIEYVIVDQKQLNIFYRVKSSAHSRLAAETTLSTLGGAPMDGFALFSPVDVWNRAAETGQGELLHITVDFYEQQMPSGLLLNLKLYPQKENDRGEGGTQHPSNYLAEFSIPLRFDPSHTAQGEIYPLNQTIELDGQRLTITSVELYPTHLRLNLKDHPENTAWLKSLNFYARDDQGNRFGEVNSGIHATGSPDSPMMVSHRLESAFFSKGEGLSIYITGAVWLDKGMEQVEVNLATAQAAQLPEGVTLNGIVRKGDHWELSFIANHQKANHIHQLFEQDYYDAAGNKYILNSWGSHHGSALDGQSNGEVAIFNGFEVMFTLENYPYDVVYLRPTYSRTVTLDNPLVIKIK